MTSQHAGQQVLEGLIVADDLTGAADSAVAFASAGLSTRVLFAGSGDGLGPTGRPHELDQATDRNGPRVLALDTDSRRLDPHAAGRAVAATVAGAPAARFLMKKIDSTLRGNIGAEVRALMEGLGCRLAICAPAFPGADRVTREGVQWASGRAVGELASSFPGVPTAHIGLGAVRAGRGAALLEQAAADHAGVVLVDAETDEDLGEIVSFGSTRNDVLWVGSGGLGAALARATATSANLTSAYDRRLHIEGPALVVVGSATTTAAAQADRVVATGAVEVTVPAGALITGEAAHGTWTREAAAGLARGLDVVVRIGEGNAIVPGHGRAIVDALADAFVPTLREVPPAVLVATGGETALSFGLALGAHGLEVAAELEPGVVYSRLAGGAGLPVVTKAGAFGDAGTLARALERLRQPIDQPEGLR